MMEATYKREDVMQALVAAMRFGEDIGIAAHAWLTGREDAITIDEAHLYPGAGIQVSMTQMAADLLADAHITYCNMPPNECFRYGREHCNLITFNHPREVSTHDDQEAAQGD